MKPSMKPIITLLALSLCLNGQEQKKTEIIVHDPSFTKLLDPAATIEVLASGFQWSEGPVWDAANNRVLFADIPNNTVHSWSEVKGLEDYLKPSGFTGRLTAAKKQGANGLAFDLQGRLLSCEHGDRRISVLGESGGKRTLVDNYDGKQLHSPNDLVVHSSGAIFFTDPPYGLPDQGAGPEREIPENGVYRRDPDGNVVQVIADLIRPNGVALSPDEKTLYIAQSHKPAAHIMSYAIDEKLNLGPATLFFDTAELPDLPGLPDGLKPDREGNIWSTGPGGVFVLSPEGKLLGQILTGRRTANLAWGGEDFSTLYLTAHQDLLRVKTLISGAPPAGQSK